LEECLQLEECLLQVGIDCYLTYDPIVWLTKKKKISLSILLTFLLFNDLSISNHCMVHSEQTVTLATSQYYFCHISSYKLYSPSKNWFPNQIIIYLCITHLKCDRVFVNSLNSSPGSCLSCDLLQAN